MPGGVRLGRLTYKLLAIIGLERKLTIFGYLPLFTLLWTAGRTLTKLS